MNTSEHSINDFLVNVYNQIYKQEEAFVSSQIHDKITLNEIHVLEAVEIISQDSEVTMGKVSKHLRISLGSLTVSSNRLIKKGYLEKEQDYNDKRVKKLNLTNEGLEVLEIHHEWHKKLINNIKESLSVQEFDVLADTLSKLTTFFERKDNNE